ncbi:hypothetical protein NMW25_28060, partial [Escherichia coli]|nr:hypothetical protein [Escherichia coli]
MLSNGFFQRLDKLLIVDPAVAAQDFLALLSEALAGETTTDKAAPQLLVATDKPTTKGEPLIS